MISSIIGIALDCKDADALADFYAQLLGLEKTISSGSWAGIHTPQGIILAFQKVEEYVPPVWPWERGEQQQMAHRDFRLISEKRWHTMAVVPPSRHPYRHITVMIDLHPSVITVV